MAKPDIAGDRWVAIYQSICSSSIWTETTPLGKCLAFWLIIHANHKIKRWHGITIKKGQAIQIDQQPCRGSWLQQKIIGSKSSCTRKIGIHIIVLNRWERIGGI